MSSSLMLMLLLSSSLLSLLLMVRVRGEPTMCSPKLWEGYRWSVQVTHTDQGVDLWESTSHVTVDVTGQRVASSETGVRHGQQYSIFYLFYYPAKTLYKVENGNCQSSDLTGSVKPQCIDIPDKNAAEYLNEFLPTYINGTLCNGVRGEREGVGYFHSVAPMGSGPFPVMDETHGVLDGVPTYQLHTYYNVTSGIKDPSVFTPPDNCIKLQEPVSLEDIALFHPPSFFLD